MYKYLYNVLYNVKTLSIGISHSGPAFIGGIKLKKSLAEAFFSFIPINSMQIIAGHDWPSSLDHTRVCQQLPGLFQWICTGIRTGLPAQLLLLK